mgnify:CR=1 FL=1
MKKETLIIPDLHGQIEVVEKLVQFADSENMNIIFLGDLTDSFTKSIKKQIQTMELVLSYMYKGHYCLWGNHDLSYIYPAHHKCSGWTYKKAEKYSSIYDKFKFHENFIPYYYFENHKILITHAGLTDKLIPKAFKQRPILFLQKESKREDFIEKSSLMKVGSSSGGWAKYGGITWMRPVDYFPLPGIRQVAGHTALRRGINKSKKNLWIIDTIEYGNKSVVKITTDGIIKEITYDEYK